MAYLNELIDSIYSWRKDNKISGVDSMDKVKKKHIFPVWERCALNCIHQFKKDFLLPVCQRVLHFAKRVCCSSVSAISSSFAKNCANVIPNA